MTTDNQRTSRMGSHRLWEAWWLSAVTKMEKLIIHTASNHEHASTKCPRPRHVHSDIFECKKSFVNEPPFAVSSFTDLWRNLSILPGIRTAARNTSQSLVYEDRRIECSTSFLRSDQTNICCLIVTQSLNLKWTKVNYCSLVRVRRSLFWQVIFCVFRIIFPHTPPIATTQPT